MRIGPCESARAYRPVRIVPGVSSRANRPVRIGSREKCPKAKVGLIRIPVSVNFKGVESCSDGPRGTSGSAFRLKNKT